MTCSPRRPERLTISALRMHAQGIAGPRFEGPEEVVRWMGALQAQDRRQALWAVGLRMREPSLAAVERALADGAIVWTWPLRGTLHLVASEDTAWMLELAGARALRAGAGRRRALGLDEATLERAAAAFRAALTGGGRRTRREMLDVLKEVGIDPAGQRGYHILRDLAMGGVLCLGPLDGRQQTFVLLEEWVPAPRRLERGAALAELAVRYFTSHGPATVHDFAWWSGLTVGQAREGVGAAEARLLRETFDGRELWRAGDTVAPGPGMPHLLPGFDEYLLGYVDRSDVLAPAHAERVAPGRNGIFRPLVVEEGEVVGTWRFSPAKRDARLEVTPFLSGGADVAALERAAERYRAFLDEAEVRVEVVDPRGGRSK